MIDNFYLSAYWGSRAETLQEVVDKTWRTFDDLMKLDEQFSRWYIGGESRKAALEREVILDKASIEKLYLNELKKNELDDLGYSKNGFIMSLWTGHKDDESSGISFAVGHAFNSPHISNSCVINIPGEGEARERLPKIDKMKTLIGILVEQWDPDHVVLVSKNLKAALGTINELGWITYRKNLKPGLNLSDKVIHTRLGPGHLFCLNLEARCYDYGLAKELLPLKHQ